MYVRMNLLADQAKRQRTARFARLQSDQVTGSALRMFLFLIKTEFGLIGREAASGLKIPVNTLLCQILDG